MLAKGMSLSKAATHWPWPAQGLFAQHMSLFAAVVLIVKFLCPQLHVLAIAAMEAIQAIWAKPFDPRMIANQTCAVRTTQLMRYAEQAKEQFRCTDGSFTEYDLFNLPSFQNYADVKVRNKIPDLTDMKLLAPLISLLLDFGPDLTKAELETMLIAVHEKLRLRKPVQYDDNLWLKFQAMSLMRIRSRSLVIKKYPDRVAYRMAMRSSEDLEVLAGLLAQMSWQPVLVAR